jgi:hypothetical protein
LPRILPNPFNPGTNIRYSIASGAVYGTGSAAVRVAVFDVLGREVAVLVDAVQTPGTHAVRFDAAGLASGMYICRLQVCPSESVPGSNAGIGAGSYTDQRKMILLR